MTQDFHYSLLKLHVGLQFRGLSSSSNMPKASRSFVLSVRLIPIVLKVYSCQISSLTYRYVNSSIKDNVTTVVVFFLLFYWYIHQVQSLRSHFLLLSHAIICCNISFNLLHYWYFIFSEGMITVQLPLYMRSIYEYVRIEIKLLCIIANYFFLYALLVYLKLRQL